MRAIVSYCRLILFVLGVLAGVQVPHFVDQYGKSLQSHYLESEKSISEFRQEAEKYFDGDLEQLIAYYKQSDDRVFAEGGDSIDAIYQRYLLLQKALTEFGSSPFNAYQQTFLAPVSDIRQEVRNNFSYAIQLTPTAIGMGLVIGFILAVIGEIVMRLILWPLKQNNRAKRYTPQ
ncbi:MAG: DUF2937 family protein [Pseudomonadota bacterium]